jgi:hypothetical protein
MQLFLLPCLYTTIILNQKKMRISGTYIEKTLYYIPYTIIIIIFLAIFEGIKINAIIYLFFIITFFLGVVNFILAYFLGFYTLTITDTIFFDEEEVNPLSIVQIEEDDFAVGGKFRINAIKFTANKDGKQITYRVMAKPYWVFINHSKTYDLLFKQFPELKSKLIK